MGEHKGKGREMKDPISEQLPVNSNRPTVVLTSDCVDAQRGTVWDKHGVFFEHVGVIMGHVWRRFGIFWSAPPRKPCLKLKNAKKFF